MQPARMLASVSSRSSPSQFAGGEPDAHTSAVGKKLDGLPLTERVLAFMAARLPAPAYAFCSPIALVAGAPIVWPVASKNCASAHAAAAVVSSLMVTVVVATRLLHGPSAAISSMAELAPAPALP